MFLLASRDYLVHNSPHRPNLSERKMSWTSTAAKRQTRLLYPVGYFFQYFNVSRDIQTSSYSAGIAVLCLHFLTCFYTHSLWRPGSRSRHSDSLRAGWIGNRIPMAALSKAWVYGRSLAGIADSNPAGGMDLCFVLYSKDKETSTEKVQRGKKRRT